MTGNTFATEVVDRAIELMRAGATYPRGTISHEYPELTAQGLDRVLDLACAEIAEQKREGRAA
jgi:hypothetical protein